MNKRHASGYPLWRLMGVGALGLVLCSGCFEVSQEVWIRDDHTGRVRMEFGVSEAWVMLGAEADADPMAELRQSFAEAKQELDADENVAGCLMEEYSHEGLRYLVLDVELRDAAQLSAAGLPGALGKGAFMGAAPAEGVDVPESSTRFVRLPNGNVEFLQVLDTGDADADAAPAAPDDPMVAMGEAMGRAMLAGMFGNRAITVTLHAPHIVSTNGQVNEERTTVVWRVPLADVLGQETFHQELRAEYEPPIAWSDWILLAAGLWVGFMVFVVVATRVRRRRVRAAASDAPPT